MGLFDFLRKGQTTGKKQIKVEMMFHEPTRKETEQQWKVQATERVRNFQKDEAGLYPYEILMLSYLEKYSSGKEPAKFWEREYGIDSVPALILSLEQRGFAKGGKLTEAGKSEVAKNEYVLYMHRHKLSDISLARMSILVNQSPNRRYQDLLWGEFNRLSMEYIKDQKWGLYRNIKYSMYRFLLEEKRYVDALPLLSKVFFYDLNGSNSPFLGPTLIEEIRTIERKIDFTDEQMIDVLQRVFSKIYAPYRNYSNDEVICIIVAYGFGHNNIAEKVLKRSLKR